MILQEKNCDFINVRLALALFTWRVTDPIIRIEIARVSGVRCDGDGGRWQHGGGCGDSQA